MRPYIWNRRQKQGKREVERDFHIRLEFLDLGVPKAVQPMNFSGTKGLTFQLQGLGNTLNCLSELELCFCHLQMSPD